MTIKCISKIGVTHTKEKSIKKMECCLENFAYFTSDIRTLHYISAENDAFVKYPKIDFQQIVRALTNISSNSAKQVVLTTNLLVSSQSLEKIILWLIFLRRGRRFRKKANILRIDYYFDEFCLTYHSYNDFSLSFH